MKTIEATAVVGSDRKIVLDVPPDVALGEHQIVVVIDEKISSDIATTMADWPKHNAGLAPGVSLRREDMYGDDGR